MRKEVSCWLAALALVGLLFASNAAVAQETADAEAGEKAPAKKVVSLLPNASLEKWTEKGEPEGWQVCKAKDCEGTVTKETVVVHSGKAAAKYQVDAEGRGLYIRSTFKNEPGKRYRLTFYYNSPVGAVQYAVKTSIPKRGWIAYNGKEWLTVNANMNNKAKKDTWNKVEMEFDGFSEAITVAVEVCRPAGKGKDYAFYVDDITLEVAPKPAPEGEAAPEGE